MTAVLHRQPIHDANRAVNASLASTILVLWIFALTTSDVAGQTTNVIIVENTSHHLGDGAGNEGTIFQKAFTIPSAFTSATLDFNFIGSFGPNRESPPVVSINGTSAGSISPSFPPLNSNLSCWQTNPDGSHDYNCSFHVSLPITGVLLVGGSTFRIANGRPDDDYVFANVVVKIVYATDLVATSLSWNTLQGGVDFTYFLTNGSLSTATTAKLFWANGTAVANILSNTPIFTQDIPAGFSGQSATIHVPSSAFGTPPDGTAYLLLLVDPDNIVAESNKNNNNVTLGPSSIADFPDYTGSEGSSNLSDADVTLASRVTGFLQALPSESTYQITSVYRPYAYQAHLREIRDKFVELLLQVPGVKSDPIALGGDRYRPRLKITAGTPSMLCKTVLDHVNQECINHLLRAVPPYNAPGVNKPQNSLHSVYRAQAVDIHIYRNGVEITDTVQIENLASTNHLIQPCDDEPHHFQMEGTGCNAPALQATIIGNSPINLLVQDPSGRRIGFDPSTDQVVNEIGPLADYSGTNSEPQVLFIPPGEFLRGDYLVSGIGTDVGAYNISLLVNGEDGGDLLANIQLGAGTASGGIPIAAVPPFDPLFATVRLSLERLPNGLFLHWPAWTTNLTLQEASTLSQPNWSGDNNADYSDKSMTITNFIESAKFFRLMRP